MNVACCIWEAVIRWIQHLYESHLIRLSDVRSYTHKMPFCRSEGRLWIEFPCICMSSLSAFPHCLPHSLCLLLVCQVRIEICISFASVYPINPTTYCPYISNHSLSERLSVRKTPSTFPFYTTWFQITGLQTCDMRLVTHASLGLSRMPLKTCSKIGNKLWNEVKGVSKHLKCEATSVVCTTCNTHFIITCWRSHIM